MASKFLLDDGFPSELIWDAYMKPNVDDSPQAFIWAFPDLDKLRKYLIAVVHRFTPLVTYNSNSAGIVSGLMVSWFLSFET